MDITIEWQKPVQLTRHKKPLVDEDDLPNKIEDEPGVYFFSRRFGTKFEPFYIGETLKIRSRLKDLKVGASAVPAGGVTIRSRAAPGRNARPAFLDRSAGIIARCTADGRERVTPAPT